MAFYLNLVRRKEMFIDEIYNRISIAECTRFKEYTAAVKIQAWYRGLKIRAYLRYLRESVLLIQKNFKGWKDRQYVNSLKEQQAKKEWAFYYDQMAVRIQKTWRGFHSRKRKSNFQARKRYFLHLQATEEMHRDMRQECRRRLEEEAAWAGMLRYEQSMRQFGYKNHYLLSTKAVPGVYNSPYGASASAAYLESRLKGTKFLKPSRASSGDAASNRSANNRNRASNNNNNKTVRMEQERAGLGTWKVGEGLEKSGKSADEVFEEEGDFEKAMKKSASTDKLQGPFRRASEVTRQKHKPLLPSLRCGSEYQTRQQTILRTTIQPTTHPHKHPYSESLDNSHHSLQALKRHGNSKLRYPLHLKDYNRTSDKDFVTAVQPDHNHSTPSFLSSQPFNDKDIFLNKASNKVFKTTLPPIMLFDQVNQSY